MKAKIATCRKMSSVSVRIASVADGLTAGSEWQVLEIGGQACMATFQALLRFNLNPLAVPAAGHGNLRARNPMRSKVQGKRIGFLLAVT